MPHSNIKAFHHSGITFSTLSIKLSLADCSKKANGERGDNELTEHQRGAVNDLALSWDLPVLTETNQFWLLQSLLLHAVRLNDHYVLHN